MAQIAIVYDDANVCASLAFAFRNEGHHVRSFEDPLVALPHLIAQPPDLMILNGRMPGMHGIEFFQRLRRYSRCPVVFLSASADEIEDKLADIGLSADAYVNAPFSLRQVMGLCERILRRMPTG